MQAFPSMADSYLYELLNMFSNTALTFLPILIAISAAKIFGGNQFLGAVIGMIMIHPNLVNAWSVAGGAETSTLWSWFGVWNIQNVGYQGHVIPVILSVWLMCAIEKPLHKRVPEMLDLFVTPLVSVLVAGFLSMTLIGPAFAQLESWVLIGAQALIALPLGIGAFLMGGIYAPTVVAGVHHMYNAIEMMMLADNGMNTWMPIATAANVAQGGAAMAVAFKTRNNKTKALALPAALSSFMGITEPAIFGVNIRYGRPFIAGILGGACGGAIASILHVYATANGVTGLFGFLIVVDSFVGYLLTFLVSFGVAFAASWVLGIREEEASGAEGRAEAQREAVPAASVAVTSDMYTVTSAEDVIGAPLCGTALPLSEVPDETFAQGVLGQGAAIEPSEGRVTAPADGTVETLFDTKHAIGLSLDNGAEILIHVGINTVELGGEGYQAMVSEGERVRKGQTLVSFDMDFIKSKGYSLVTPVIVTNTDDYAEVALMRSGKVSSGDALLRLTKE